MIIAQLSDIHIDDDASWARLERVLQWLRTIGPDAIAVSGDSPTTRTAPPTRR